MPCVYRVAGNVPETQFNTYQYTFGFVTKTLHISNDNSGMFEEIPPNNVGGVQKTYKAVLIHLQGHIM